jgi:hypothetical protein
MNLLKNMKASRQINATVAGTTSLAGSTLDMAGFEGVLFIAAIGTITATGVPALLAQGGNQSDGSDMANITNATSGAMTAGTDDNKIAMLDVYRPQKRYVRAVVTRGTANAVVDGVIAIQYGSRLDPPTQDATTVAKAVQVVGS